MYTKILEVNLFAFAYRLFRRDFSTQRGVLHIYVYILSKCLRLSVFDLYICIHMYIYATTVFVTSYEEAV